MAITKLPAIPDNRVSRGVRGIFIANLVAQSGIVVTGAIVRVTASGLGCPTWPECAPGSLIPTDDQAESWHKFVEFGNRLLTFVLAALAIAAVVAMVRQRRRWRASGMSTRPALLALAAVPLIGTIIQAVLGGVTVLTGLHPATVSAHFLVSMAIIAAVVALVARSGDPGDTPVTLLVPQPVRLLGWGVLAATAIVVFLGVLVTGSGPHSGDVGVDARFGFDFQTIAWLHADAVWLFLGLLIGLLIALSFAGHAPKARRRVVVLLAVAAIQGAIGYAQFFSGLPELLVTAHVIGAVLVWNIALFIPFGMRERGLVRSEGTDQWQSAGIAAPSK
jgi:cytochrome c oxidase assembly protein subunit 15